MPFRIATALCAIVFCIILGSLSFFRDLHGKENRSFALWNLTLAIWALAEVIVYVEGHHQLALVLYRLCYIAGSFIAFSFLRFLFSILEYKITWQYRLIKWLTVTFALLSMTSLIIKDIQYDFGQTSPITEIPGVLYNALIIFLISSLGYSLYPLIYSYRKSSGALRNQLQYVALAICIGILALSTFIGSQISEKIPPVYYLLEMAIISVFAYAIVKHRLMDFNLLVRMGLSYGVVLTCAGVILLGTLYGVERISDWANMASGVSSVFGIMVAVFIYETWGKRVKNFVDHYIYQSPDLKELLQQIQVCMTNSKNLNQLGASLSEKLKTIWKVEHAGIVVWDSSFSNFKPFPIEEFEGNVINRVIGPITSADFLIKTLESERRLFQYGVVHDDELTAYSSRAFPGEKVTFQKIRRSMRWFGATVCVPIMNKDQLIGFLVLGEKKSGTAYNNEDKKILSHVGEILSEATLKMMYQAA